MKWQDTNQRGCIYPPDIDWCHRCDRIYSFLAMLFFHCPNVNNKGNIKCTRLSKIDLHNRGPDSADP
jgi:hypothetical protein